MEPPGPFCICFDSLLQFELLWEEGLLCSSFRASCRGFKGTCSDEEDWEVAPDHSHFKTDMKQLQIQSQNCPCLLPLTCLAFACLRSGFSGFSHRYPASPFSVASTPPLVLAPSFWHMPPLGTW